MRNQIYLHILIFLTFCLKLNSLLGQCNYLENFINLEILGVDQGVSAGLVYQVTQDRNGYLWLATTQGLNRYDGYRIKEYINNPNDSLSLPENHIIAVHVDKRGNLWVGLLNEGVYLYNPYQETFHKVNSSIISRFHEDYEGNIWVDNEEGKWNVIQIENHLSNKYTFPNLEKIRINKANKLFDGLPETMSALSFINQDYISWLVEDSIFSYRLEFDRKKAKLNFIRLVDRIIYTEDNKYSPIIKNPLDKNELLVFLYDSYLTLNIETGDVLNQVCIPSQIQEFKLTPRICDKKGRIWLCGDQINCCLLDLETNTFSNIRKSGIEAYFPNWKLLCAYPFQDKDENIWLPSKGYGVYKYNYKSERFNYFGTNNIGPSIPPLLDQNGLLIFNDIVSVKKFNPSKDQSIQYFNSNSNNTYNAAYLSPSKKLWLHNIYNNGEKEFLTEISNNGKVIRKIPWYTDYSLFIKRELIFTEEELCWEVAVPKDKNVAIQYPFLTLKLWDLKMNTKKEFPFKRPGNGFIYGDLQDKLIINDKIWLAFSEGGLISYDIKSNSWKHYTYDKSNQNTIASNRVLSFCQDPMHPMNVLWIGTTNGLNRFHIDSARFERFSVEDGLPNNVIYGILFDHMNNLWLSTNHGLSIFNYNESSVRNFTKSDGLQHNEFNKGAFVKDDHGTMYFGGVGGLNWFDPKDFYDEYESSTILINGLKINNEDIIQNQPNNLKSSLVLENPIEYTDELILSYKDQRITFSFTCLDLSNPIKNKYKFKLDGFNEDWIEVGSAHEATYTNLPAGVYKFKVMACNSENVWSTKPASLLLRVLPPWWKTWWFRLLMFCLTSIGVYLIYMNRIRAKERILHLRNQISNDLHDEIGSTLSSISLFGTVAIKLIEKEPKAATEMIHRINNSTTGAMEAINDIIWIVNSDNDNINSIVQRMRAYIYELGDASNIEIDFYCDPSLRDSQLNMSQRRNMYLIFKEAVNNALKYSKCNKLTIKIKRSINGLKLTIIDDGIGFDLNNLDQNSSLGGNGLNTMKKRALNLGGKLTITSNPNNGTIIDFVWPFD